MIETIGHEQDNLRLLIEGKINFQQYLEKGTTERLLLGFSQVEVEAWQAEQINLYTVRAEG